MLHTNNKQKKYIFFYKKNYEIKLISYVINFFFIIFTFC